LYVRTSKYVYACIYLSFVCACVYVYVRNQYIHTCTLRWLLGNRHDTLLTLVTLVHLYIHILIFHAYMYIYEINTYAYTYATQVRVTDPLAASATVRMYIYTHIHKSAYTSFIHIHICLNVYICIWYTGCWVTDTTH